MKDSEARQFFPGCPVWVIERLSSREPVEVSQLMFIAECEGFVIASPYVNDAETAEDIMVEECDNTTLGVSSDLQVYPQEDVFADEEQAEAELQKMKKQRARNKEQNDDDDGWDLDWYF